MCNSLMAKMETFFCVILLLNKIGFSHATWNVPNIEIEPKNSSCKDKNVSISNVDYKCIDQCPYAVYSYDSANSRETNIYCNYSQDQYFLFSKEIYYTNYLGKGIYNTCNFQLNVYPEFFNLILTFIIINENDNLNVSFGTDSISFHVDKFDIIKHNMTIESYTYEKNSWILVQLMRHTYAIKGEIEIKIQNDVYNQNYNFTLNRGIIIMKKNNLATKETNLQTTHIKEMLLYNLDYPNKYDGSMDARGNLKFDTNCKCKYSSMQEIPMTPSLIVSLPNVKIYEKYDTNDLINNIQSNECSFMLNQTHYIITSVYEEKNNIFSPDSAITDTSLLTKWISSPEYNIINVNVINNATVCSNEFILMVRMVVSIQSIRVYTDNKTLYEIECSLQYGCLSSWSGTLGFTIRDSKCNKIAIQLTRRSSDNTLPVAVINKISIFTTPNLTCTNFYKDLNQKTYGQILFKETFAQDENIYSHNPYNICFSPINSIFPNVSIIDGGRNITLGGRVDNYFDIYIGDQPCIMIPKSTSECIAPKKTNLTSNITYLYLRHKHTHIVYEFYKFEYIKNPKITKFFQRNTTISGGLNLRVEGIGFNNIGSIQLISHLYVLDKYNQRIYSPCKAKSDTIVVCITPTLTNIDFNNIKQIPNNEMETKELEVSDKKIIRNKRQNQDLRVIYGMTFDNYELYLNISQTFQNILFNHIFPDPIIFEFKDGYATFYNFASWIDEFFEIKGKNLENGKISDYTVKVNSNRFTVTEMFGNKLIVKPNLENYERCASLDVIVYFGKLNIHVGKLRIYQSISCVTIWLSVVIVVPILVVLSIIIIIMIYIKKVKLPSKGNVTELSYAITKSNYYHLPKVYSETVPELIEELKKYDLPSNKITLLDNIIGSGAYGCVYIGIYQKHKVALKTPKDRTPKCIQNFMLESSIMAKLSGGNYVLKQIGVSILDNRIYSVTPYMNCGDLNNYLKSNPDIKMDILYKFMTAIAEGMNYIANEKYVHRDLATRNCLVNNYETVYIADFGLCKKLDDKGNYCSLDFQEKMPLLWCALECLNEHIFNEKTDVWAYGVLVWELFSNGNRPYSNLKDVRQYKKFIEDSYRLKKPQKCPQVSFDLMSMCWHQNIDKRPYFSDIINMIKKDDYYTLPQKN